jgi:hypothetical protein
MGPDGLKSENRFVPRMDSLVVYTCNRDIGVSNRLAASNEQQTVP